MPMYLILELLLLLAAFDVDRLVVKYADIGGRC